MKRYITVLLMMLIAPLHAEDRIQLEKDNVIGNEEAPKALYVVPWRPLQPVGVAGLEIQSLLDEELELIDPEVFKRRVELYRIKKSAKAIK